MRWHLLRRWSTWRDALVFAWVTVGSVVLVAEIIARLG